MVRSPLIKYPLTLFAVLLALGAEAGGSAFAADVPVWRSIADQSRLEFMFEQAGDDERGRFKRFEAVFHFDPEHLSRSRIEATIEMASVETGDDERDDILRSADLFAVERWPNASFRTLAIEKRGDGQYMAEAELTIRDRTRTLDFPFTLNIQEKDGAPVLYMTAEVTIKRLDYGVGQGDWESTKWVPDEVRVRVDVTAERSSEAAGSPSEAE